MTISPFGFFLIIYYIFILATKSRKECFVLSLVLLLLCSITVQMGYFLSIGEKTYSYSMIVTVVSAFLGERAPIINNEPLSKQKKVSIFLIISVIISFIGLKFIPYGGTIIENSDYEGFLSGTAGYGKLSSAYARYGYLYVLIFLLYVLIRIKRCLCFSDLMRICKKFVNIAVNLVVILGFAEFVAENVFNSLFVTDTTIAIFGEVEGQQHSLDLREGLYAMQGTTKEASMFSVSLLYTALTTICLACSTQTKKARKKVLFIFFLLVLLMLLNRSMSSFMYVFIALYCLAYINPLNLRIFDNRKFLIYSLVGLISLIIILPSLTSILIANGFGDNYFVSRLSLSTEELNNFSSNQFSKSSEGARYIGMYYCLEAFYNRPIFGVGISNLTCLSGLICLLSNIGLIGVYLWMRICALFADTTLSRSIIPITIVFILPNILLNDIGTILSFAIPFVFAIVVFFADRKNVGHSTFSNFQKN